MNFGAVQGCGGTFHPTCNPAPPFPAKLPCAVPPASFVPPGAWMPACEPAWWLDWSCDIGACSPCTWYPCGPLPPQLTCPQVATVGACCSSCAEGHSCTGTTGEVEEQVGAYDMAIAVRYGAMGDRNLPLEVPQVPGLLRTPRVAGITQAIVGAEAIPFSKAEELNTQIIKLSADTGEWATKKVGTFPPSQPAAEIAAKFSDPADGAFFLDFRQFKADWDAFLDWRHKNPPPLWVPVPEIAMTDLYGDLPKYRALLDRYQALLERAKNRGVITDAAVPEQKSPVEQGLEDVAKGAGKGAEAAAKALAEIGIYAVVVGGGIAILYFFGPQIVGSIAKVVRK